MTKKEMMSRWKIVKVNLQKRGMEPELDMLSEYAMNVVVGSRQNLSELIEWAYDAWPDVKSAWQSRDETHRYFGIAFRKPKGWKPDGDEEDD